VEKAALIYDGSCGFCRAAVRGARALDRNRSLFAVAAQSAEGRLLTPSLSDRERLASFHLVENGEVRSGADAIASTLRLLPSLRPAAMLLDRSRVANSSAAAVYRWVARERGRLGRLLLERWKRPL
jgi:predicted DCC family thiol-disulfide oxidoreductase YuxK